MSEELAALLLVKSLLDIGPAGNCRLKHRERCKNKVLIMADPSFAVFFAAVE